MCKYFLAATESRSCRLFSDDVTAQPSTLLVRNSGWGSAGLSRGTGRGGPPLPSLQSSQMLTPLWGHILYKETEGIKNSTSHLKTFHICQSAFHTCHLAQSSQHPSPWNRNIYVAERSTCSRSPKLHPRGLPPGRWGGTSCPHLGREACCAQALPPLT